jgi:hypothetical protein
MAVHFKVSAYELSPAYMAECYADVLMEKAEQTKDLDDFIDAFDAHARALRAKIEWIEKNPDLKPEASTTVWQTED